MFDHMPFIANPLLPAKNKNRHFRRKQNGEYIYNKVQTVETVPNLTCLFGEGLGFDKSSCKLVWSVLPKQKNKKDKSVPTETATQSPKELLAVVKKTSFNDAEAQKLIDLLLTKQSGDALNTSDEWIEKGKPTETQ